MSENLASFVTESAEKFGDRPALKLDDTVVNYALLNEGSARIAHLLKEKGLERGDRVGIMLPNVPYFAIVYYGILRAGGVVVPMNVLLKGREVAFYLEDPGAKILFAWHDFADAAGTGAEKAGAELISVKPGEFEELLGSTEADHDVADVDAEDTAVILYTSGTTGTPKGAELTHGNLKKNAEVDRRHPRPHHRGRRRPRRAAAVPLLRADVRPQRRRLQGLVPDADPALRPREGDGDHRARPGDDLPGRPDDVRRRPQPAGRQDPATRRACGCACRAARRCPSRSSRASRRSSAARCSRATACSETSPVASFNHPDRDRKPGSIGTPIEGVEMKLVDDDGNDVEGTDEVGEIAIRGHNVMKGYWNREDATKEVLDDDGWFRTGDMGKRDEDGYYFIVDRKKEMIIRGGYNVYPREIEEVLYEHPAVAEAAVIGVPDDKMGEEVGAAVVLKEGKEVDADELRDFVKEQVANYKYPRRIWFPDELPKGPTGKILKREVEVPEEAKTA